MYKILLAEDENSIRENIHKGIAWEKYGFSIVDEASNGSEALEKLQKARPDVLLSDIRMPFLDGIELARLSKQIFPTIEIVFLSGYSDFAYAQEAIAIGVFEYIVKPVTPIKLVRMLMRLKDRLDTKLIEREGVDDHRKRFSEIVKEMSGNDLLVQGKMEESLMEFLRKGDRTKESAFVGQYLAPMRTFLHDATYCTFIAFHTLVECLHFIEDIGGETKEISPFGAEVDGIESEPLLTEYLVRMLGEVVSIRNRITDSSAVAISKAKAYVREHYGDFSLMLDRVSSFVGVSPNYLSYLFKQTEGMSFIKYLTSIRMEKAKEYLRTTSFTNQEIAERIGYNDVNYFSAVFHKNTGVTPREYRNR
jgi:two-component system response regulator YesN